MQKILVANRGEIALRIMRTIRDMGLASVAVYSEPDRLMPFVRFADEAVLLGGASSRESYLNGEAIIRCALDRGADAIHPGYGFLSENAEFAAAVRAAGLVFIGPSEHAIRIMGDKLAAKQAAAAFGVPMVPGCEDALTDLAKAQELAEEIGYPILLKAAGGGGGKGMRVVQHPGELESQWALARSEAWSAFGNDAVFMEKYLQAPRHIEIQVLGDQHGHLVHLFERECSIQRRHQKLVEEAPSSCLDPELRDRMGTCALEVARSCGYYGAGTVEFLLDETRQFYFLEMNTRLQVEHPVTELITGLDLVKEQIRIADGEPLAFSQADLSMHGHAIELRVCAEDPHQGFLPDTGRLEHYRRPLGPGIRVDDGYEEGQEVSIHYDPMMAKLVAWGSTRSEAIARLHRAIGEYEVRGVATTLPFGAWVMQHPAFREGNFDTHFIEKHFKPEYLNQGPDLPPELLAVLGAFLWNQQTPLAVAAATPAEGMSRSPWKRRNRI